MGEQDHTWEEGDPIEADKENPTGVLANIDHPQGKALLAPLDLPEVIKDKDAVLIDAVDDVIGDVNYVYDETEKAYKLPQP